MSLQTIEMHFEEVMKLSELLSGLAKELKGLGDEEVMRLSASVRKGWSSECADAVAGKEARLGGQLISEAELLLGIANELEQKAGKMYRTELMNSHTAAIRIYL